MIDRTRLLAIAATLFLGTAIAGADEPKPAAPPPPEKPANPPPAEPKPGEPKPSEPKPGEPPGKKPGDKPDLPEDPPEEKPPPAPEGVKDEAPPPSVVVQDTPGEGGTRWVDVEGETKIGTPADVVFKMASERKDIAVILKYEAPLHVVHIPAYYMGAGEVSNAQWKAFLDATARTTYRTGSSALANLDQIASFFVYGNADQAAAEKDDTSWAQLYELNRVTLQKEMPKVTQKSEFRFAALPPDVDLTVYRRRLPRHWFASSAQLEGDAKPDHPVRWVSYLDALAFTDWAGLHVPTEAEWEWAARGPEQRPFPWGDTWLDGMSKVDRMKRLVEPRCNWLDLKIENAKHEPTTLPVDALPEGRSWCGCFNMLGNVAEWTSSWFDAYPGAPDLSKDPNNRWADYTGEYVKVIRGAAAINRDRIFLRSAARDFIGEGSFGPPKPMNSYNFVGFRYAMYLQPGLDRLEPTVAKLSRPKKITADRLDASRFGGAIARHLTPKDAVVPDHVHVLGAASAVIMCPTLGLETSPDQKSWAESAPDVLGRSNFSEPRILGVFATDVGIAQGKVLEPVKKGGDKSQPPGGGILRGNKPRPTPPPALIDGKIAAGAYIFGLQHEKIGLYESNLTLVGFLPTKPEIKAYNLKKDESPPATLFTVEPDADLVKCTFWMPFGGKGADPTKGVLISFTIVTDGGALAKAGEWRFTAPDDVKKPDGKALPGKAPEKGPDDKPPAPAKPPEKSGSAK